MALVDIETDSSSFPSSSSAAARRKYDVFLSFRGEDTRYKFMGHLYEALIQKGIFTFKDDEKLERGEPISPDLLKAIEESRFAVVILSENYASSTWCLDELAKIICCKNETGMTVLPVFHYVEPSDVRKQMGTFALAFAKHEEKENKERVEKWRDALTQVGSLRGWHLKDHWSEIENIKDIVGWISLHLKYDALPYIAKDLVGINSRMEELEARLALGSNDVRFIGIWGMGGMGKTTLARVVYYMVSIKFEACSFIEDVREKSERDGLVGLQQKLISDILKEKDLKISDKYDGVINIKNRLCCKRILLVIDDVDKLDQLKFLVGEHDWFGPGSRIIITTRDEHVLKTREVNEIYEVDGLNGEHALQLFSSKAFKGKHDLDDYLELSNHFLKYAGGLLLALEVLGSFLIGKSIAEWKSALERLKEFPERTILQVLKISFDGLHDTEKEIFLHIACFFNHREKDGVVEVLDSLGLLAVIGLKELINKSLLKIDCINRLWMHDLLEEMGKNIVFQECPNDCGRRSRLWNNEDIENVLEKNQGTEKVQAMRIVCDMFLKKHVATWNPDAFLKMYNLRFLEVFWIRNYVPTHLPGDLRILDWIGYPSKSLPSSFQSDELVQLRLQWSQIEQLWIGIKNFDKLKLIDLSYSFNLIISPELTGVPNLKELILQNCRSLHELHPSVAIHKKLVHLNLNGCRNLVCLPSTICSLNSLERFKNLPENLWMIEDIEKLDLSGTAIEGFPSSIERLTSLTSLTLKNCKNLVCFPSIICSLNSLECLDLCGCSNIDNLPENLENLKSLKFLDLSGTSINVPSSIECLTSLTSLALLNCKKLVSPPISTHGFKFYGALNLSICPGLKNLPENLWMIKELYRLDLSKTAIEELPSSIECLTNLTVLTLRYCTNLVRLPSTICSLKLLNSLDLYGCLKFVNFPKNIGNMKGLEVLNLCWTAIKEVPSSIVLLKNLKHLHIRGWTLSEFYSQPASSLESMGPLWTSLFSLPTSPDTERILLPSFLYYSLPTSSNSVGLLLPSLSGLRSLTYLRISDCDLWSIPNDIGCLFSLEILNLSGNNFVSLPESMSQLYNLRRLYLEGCKRLQSLENVPSTINFVIANDCISLERLPELQFDPFRLDHSHLNFQCLNCFKLVDYIQSGGNTFKGLPHVIIPGSEIPKWFNLECRGDNIQVSFAGCDKLMGIALSVGFVPNGSRQYYSDWQLSCSFHVNGFKIAYFIQSYYLMTKYGKVESPHLWLLYLSTHHSVSNWGKICSHIDANGFSQLEIKILVDSVEVEKIGVHLVYKQDIEDSNETMAQCINNSSTLYGDLGVIHHDIDNSDIESSRNKQSHDVDDGAGSSGEGYSDKEPQPKWIHRVRAFMADSEDLSQREIFDFFAKDEMSKKLESIHGGKSNSYHDIEDFNQTITQLSINSRTLSKDLGDHCHDLYNSAAEGSRNKRSRDEEDGAGPSGEAYSNDEPHPKTWRMYGIL
uniref:TIR domain-containing protein n=1 Tax=Quercus lobata TaxID=97700 RepID=A0A7N2MZ71_QUELO